MKLTRNGIKEREAWKKAGIDLPGYDVEAVTEKRRRSLAGYISESEIFSCIYRRHRRWSSGRGSS